jgi:hypothetical protein
MIRINFKLTTHPFKLPILIPDNLKGVLKPYIELYLDDEWKQKNIKVIVSKLNQKGEYYFDDNVVIDDEWIDDDEIKLHKLLTIPKEKRKKNGILFITLYGPKLSIFNSILPGLYGSNFVTLEEIQKESDNKNYVFTSDLNDNGMRFTQSFI